MDKDGHRVLTFVFIGLMYLWPPVWRMRWQINRRKRQLNW